ncbi:MAG: KEOPS complex kinase/ATPase Bud32 [Nanoarchaeota archaeon]
MKLISQGAEARIYQDGERILKQRIAKSYRLPGLDLQLRKQRTRSEAKLLQKAAGIAPKLLAVDEHTMTLTLEYLDGKLLKDVLSTFSSQERHNFLLQLGKHIAQLHQQNIIHGDLTTSNILMHNNTPYLIDFGLGFISLKPEDKAVDLHLLKHALMSKHFSLSAAAFASVLEGYSSYPEHRAVIQRLEKVERRGRYKQK